MKKLLIVEICILLLLLAAAGFGVFGVLYIEPAPAEMTAPTTEPEPQWQVVAPETIRATWQTYADKPLACEQFFVYDCTADVMLAQSGDNTKLYPASITKLLTAYTALQFVSPETEIVAGDALSLVDADASIAFIQKGDTLTMEQLVEAMLLPSGNDAAYMTAVTVGRILANDRNLSPEEAMERFVRQMNIVAKNAGMTGSNFVNPDGYHHDDHYTCFRDLAILGKLAMKNKLIMKYAALPEGNNPNYNEDLYIPQWKNTNLLIHPDSDFYCSYARGLKTGQTSNAGKCLLSAFDYEGRKLIIGVFGCPEYEDRYADTLHIFSQIVGATE